jgi:hypothetical protein
MTVNSPRRKEAARTIKRIAVKQYTKGKYGGFKGMSYTGIKAGRRPTNASALMRRMKMFRVTVNTPLYRGLQNFKASVYKREPIYNALTKPGGSLKNSFASFSKSKNYAAKYAWKGLVLVLPPGRYPAINAAKFGYPKNREAEITLAPGVYTLNTTRNITRNRNVPFVPVKYKAFNNFYAVNNNLL